MPLRRTQDLLVFYESVRNRCSSQQMIQLIYVLQRLNADKIRGTEVWEELHKYFAEDALLKDEFAGLFTREYTNVPASIASTRMQLPTVIGIAGGVPAPASLADTDGGGNESDASYGGSFRCSSSSLASSPVKEEGHDATSKSTAQECNENAASAWPNTAKIGKVEEASWWYWW